MSSFYTGRRLLLDSSLERVLIGVVRHQKCYKHKCSATETHRYHCAQSDERQKKPKVSKGGKARDARRMERFPCSGWLQIRISTTSDIAEVTVHHKEAHLPYVDISLPEEWKTYIEKNALDQTPGQVQLNLAYQREG